LDIESLGESIYASLLWSENMNTEDQPPNPLAATIHPGMMALDEALLKEPFQKLSKALMRHSKLALPEEVHRLRTQTRRLEATIQALAFDQKKSGDRLLKSVKKIRKAAGKVRDTDVHIALASSLVRDSEDDGAIRLVEYLGSYRVTAVAALQAAIVKQRDAARHYLKRCLKLLEKNLDPTRYNDLDNVNIAAGVMSFSQELERRLADWPSLDSENLHSYRLKVKELRYVLEFTQGGRSSFVEKLGEIKDRIGEWHDWRELSKISTKVLGDAAADKTTGQIRRIVKKKLALALAATNSMRAPKLNVFGRQERTRKQSLDH
jgi:CHAD domain-containing protein